MSACLGVHILDQIACFKKKYIPNAILINMSAFCLHRMCIDLTRVPCSDVLGFSFEVKPKNGLCVLTIKFFSRAAWHVVKHELT